ncbi:hypothetical protein Q7C36_022188 [Tachysurus vachellii]|uniref:Uncharacterized protein n=1 Tax=Tachysurus vachellii TaxID=175792 RepID=A0AA88IKF4_TACVA|nr:uncharacterized protein LOC132839520 isoform X1 [Tachysurus vachellii]KAK2818255.1 hypothetical protein Q7C36_022188 [Tachysurus vachellii]
MGRVKKGQKVQRKDLCAMVGGIDALVRTMRSFNISKTDTSYSSRIWSKLSQRLFGQDHKKNRHWLWVMWTTNRNGVRDLVTEQQTNDPQVMNNKATDCKTEEPSVFKTDKNDDERQVTEDEQQDVSLHNIVLVEEAITAVEVVSDQSDGEDVQQNVSLQDIVQVEEDITDVEVVLDQSDGEDEQQNIDQVEEAFTDVEVVLDQSDGEDEQQNIDQVEEDFTYVEVVLDQSDGEDEQENVSLQSGVQTEHGKRGNTKQCSKRFIITVNRENWQTVVPLHGSTKLRQPWTHVLYNSFKKKNPCCTLSFRSQHIKTPHSRKINSPYLNITAVCTFPSCSAKYYFKRKKEPVGDDPVKIYVLQRGQIAHKKSE